MNRHLDTARRAVCFEKLRGTPSLSNSSCSSASVQHSSITEHVYRPTMSSVRTASTRGSILAGHPGRTAEAGTGVAFDVAVVTL